MRRSVSPSPESGLRQVFLFHPGLYHGPDVHHPVPSGLLVGVLSEAGEALHGVTVLKSRNA